MTTTSSDKKLTGSSLLDTILGVVSSTGLAAAASLGGIQGWIAKMILKMLIGVLKRAIIRMEVKSEVKKDLEKYNETIANPHLTDQERVDADVNFLGGRLRESTPKGNP